MAKGVFPTPARPRSISPCVGIVGTINGRIFSTNAAFRSEISKGKKNSGSACELPYVRFWQALLTTCMGRVKMGESLSRTFNNAHKNCSFFPFANGALLLM